MEKRIWKYSLFPEMNILPMPKDAKVLCAGEQFNYIQIWVEVDPNLETEERHFEVFGTGHPIHYDMGVERKYISSVSLDGGNLICHVYERTN